jgi:uncharacterized phage-associated protein
MTTGAEILNKDKYSRRPTKRLPLDIATDNRASDNTKWRKVGKFQYTPHNEIDVLDVVAYILQKCGEITTMKLHKLLYYAQAWSLVWDEKPLFKAPIQAWVNGPVIPTVFSYHKGMYSLSEISSGNPDALSTEQKETIDSVIDYYGEKSAQWLIELTHLEEPWIEARRGLAPMERGSNEITLESMANYYSNL